MGSQLVVLLLTEGQTNDHKGARLLLPLFPPAKELLADRGYDSDHFRSELAGRGFKPCYRRAEIEKFSFPTIAISTGSATGSKMLSVASKIGAASQCATIDEPTPSSRQSASQPTSRVAFYTES